MDGTTYSYAGENFGDSYSVLIGKPGGMWLYSFPSLGPWEPLDTVSKVTTQEGKVYRCLSADIGQITLKLLDEKVTQQHPCPVVSRVDVLHFDLPPCIA